MTRRIRCLLSCTAVWALCGASFAWADGPAPRLPTVPMAAAVAAPQAPLVVAPLQLTPPPGVTAVTAPTTPGSSLPLLLEEQAFFGQTPPDRPAVQALPTTATNLDALPLVVDFDNTTLRAAFSEILQQAAAQTGPWRLRWQLSEENQYLLNEPITLTAETTFGQLLAAVIEQVVNLSGVQLHAKQFQQGRIIVISDRV